MNQVFNVMDQLAGDTEPSVRAELMEQVEGLGLLELIFHLITMSGSPHSYVLPRTPQQRRRHGKRQMGGMLSNSDMTI